MMSINPEVGVKYRWTAPKYPKIYGLPPHLVTAVSNGSVWYRYDGSSEVTQLGVDWWRENEPIVVNDAATVIESGNLIARLRVIVSRGPADDRERGLLLLARHSLDQLESFLGMLEL